MGDDRLDVGGSVAGQPLRGVPLGRLEAWLRRPVDEEAPDVLERHLADEVLDVDSAVAQRAAVAIGLGDLGLERDHAFEAGLEIAHASDAT